MHFQVPRSHAYLLLRAGNSESFATVRGPRVTGVESGLGRLPLTPLLCPGRRRCVDTCVLSAVL